jgi:ornithine cyclodeaminase
MPAWSEAGYLGVKIASVFPGNARANKPAVAATYLLSDATDGTPLALIDGGELTARRTAATSVLAATHLAPHDAKHLVIVGTGRIARHLARAYHVCLPALEAITVWGRTTAHATALAAELKGQGIPAAPATSLEAAVRTADIVACATLSEAPLVCGRWLKPGQHIDLIGSYTPAMREADDEAVARARVVVDTGAALQEAGDITQPLDTGALTRDRITDLAALVRNPPPRNPNEITLFKSVGSALEDLAAATLACRRANTRD